MPRAAAMLDRLIMIAATALYASEGLALCEELRRAYPERAHELPRESSASAGDAGV